VDEQIPVPLPKTCHRCGGRVVPTATQPQFQEDLVRRTIVRRFDVEVGQCAGCGRQVQGRHPLQTSEALGAAQVQVGPEALALAAHLNKELGLSHERVARVLALGYGLQVSRSALCRALTRLGAKAGQTHHDATRHASRPQPAGNAGHPRSPPVLTLDPSFVLSAQLNHQIGGIRIRVKTVEGADFLADAEEHLQPFKLLAQLKEERQLLCRGVGLDDHPHNFPALLS
jgi:hypothetical protein